ncbi:MAG TPA: YjbQ family protein, partial [Anaerolineaceae bacterium]|nr:YjbQ family protein [Anaerolineaceae bacterium]
MIKEINLSTGDYQSWQDITAQVAKIVEESGVSEGLCLVHNPHSTAGIFVNSYLDPMTPKDILHDLDRLVPTRVDFFHQFDSPTDA